MYPLSYKSDICYLRNKKIEEYDMRSGGYSITISEELIDDEELLHRLKLSNKTERQILLGLYAKKDKEFVRALNAGFQKYVTAFIDLNKIPKNNVLFIKKDAVTIFASKINRTKFKKVLFTKRCEFTSFLRLKNLEFYYNGKTDEKLLKGISLDSYNDTLIEEIFKVMKLAEHSTKEVVANRLASIRHAYVTKQLADGYYRELSSTNAFLLNKDLVGNTVYSKLPLDEDDAFFDDIDISYNYVNILMPLFEVML